MAETTATDGAQEQQTPAAEPQDPFAEFTTEAFDRGEPVEDAPEPPAAEGAEGGDAGETPAEDAGEGAEGGEEEGAEPEAPKKPQTAQERINELTRARRQAEREAADLRRRLEALEQRRDETITQQEEKRITAEDAAEKVEKNEPPNPEDFEFGELDSRYIAAVVNFQTARKFEEFRQKQIQEHQQAEAQRRQQTVQAKFQEQIAQGKQKYDDYEEKVVLGAMEDKWHLSETMGLLLVESEVGEDIAYHLASHPAEAAEVFAKAPVEQARYFGKLEAKFSAARSAASGGESAEKTVTTKAPQAPAPVEPVRGAGGRFQTTAATDDFAAFEAMANKG